MQKYTYICWIHTDAINKDAVTRRRKDFFNKILPLALFVKVRKGCSRVACERELETEHKLSYLDPTVMTVKLCLSCSPDAGVPYYKPITGHWNVSLPSGASPWNSIFWGGPKTYAVCRDNIVMKFQDLQKSRTGFEG